MAAASPATAASSHLRGLRPEDLRALWPDLPLDDRLARRIQARLVWRDADDLEGVPGLSRALAAGGARPRRARRASRSSSGASSRVDPFVKYLFRAADGQVFEAVRIPLERPRWSVCVSSQVGLRAGLRLLRDGPPRAHAQPRGLGDRRAGADRPPRGAGAAGHRRRLPGPGRAVPELRQRDPRRRRSCATPAARASAATASRSRPWACCP